MTMTILTVVCQGPAGRDLVHAGRLVPVLVEGAPLPQEPGDDLGLFRHQTEASDVDGPELGHPFVPVVVEDQP